MSKSFKEIEHKFLVESGFNRTQFVCQLQAIQAVKITEVKVEDTYFVIKDRPTHLFRHRFDREIQQLTVKSVEKTPFVRTEINLELMRDGDNQVEPVQEFLGAFGLAWTKKLTKDVLVAYFPDCEIVHYRAQCGSHAIECVEFEAVGAADEASAFKTLAAYEEKLGFGAKTPESKTLFELIMLVDAPQAIVNMFRK